MTPWSFQVECKQIPFGICFFGSLRTCVAVREVTVCLTGQDSFAGTARSFADHHSIRWITVSFGPDRISVGSSASCTNGMRWRMRPSNSRTWGRDSAVRLRPMRRTVAAGKSSVMPVEGSNSETKYGVRCLRSGRGDRIGGHCANLRREDNRARLPNLIAPARRALWVRINGFQKDNWKGGPARGVPRRMPDGPAKRSA
jgi:hypothetical protein